MARLTILWWLSHHLCSKFSIFAHCVFRAKCLIVHSRVRMRALECQLQSFWSRFMKEICWIRRMFGLARYFTFNPFVLLLQQMFPRLTGLSYVSCSMEVFLSQVGLHWALIVLQSLHLLENLAVCRLLCQEPTRLVKPLVIGLVVR